jgi:type II secretory pathway component GspD/PulD (secretin)
MKTSFRCLLILFVSMACMSLHLQSALAQPAIDKKAAKKSGDPFASDVDPKVANQRKPDRFKDAAERIRARLAERSEIIFNGTPLKAVALFFSDAMRVPILIDEKALAEVGLSSDEPISLDLPEVSYRSALSVMLDPIGLVYCIRNECLVITTRQAERSSIRFFDLQPALLTNMDSQELVTMIKDLVEPTHRWSSQGGSDAICVFQSTLIVKSTEQAFWEIEELLKVLHAKCRGDKDK